MQNIAKRCKYMYCKMSHNMLKVAINLLKLAKVAIGLSPIGLPRPPDHRAVGLTHRHYNFYAENMNIMY